MQNFPCPTPTCRYVFDASMLPPAAMVTCPLCGVRFPYRAGHPIPVLTPPGAAPAPVNPPSRPTSRQPAPVEDENAFGSEMSMREPPVVRRRVQATGGGASTWIVVGIFVLFLVAGVFVATNMMKNRGIHNRETNTPRETKQTLEDLNLVIDLKDKSWKSNDDWRARLGALIVYKKEDSEAYIGVYAEDFKDRNPRPIELRKLMEKKLYQAFERDKLEMQDREGEVKWSGKSAHSVIFQGSPMESDTIYKGECFLMSHQGIAYLYFSLASLDEFGTVEASLSEMCNSFSTGKFRDGWKEKVSNTSTFASKDANFMVQDLDGVWINRGVDEAGNALSKKGSQFAVNPKDLDPKANMAFIAEMERKKSMAARLTFTPTCEAMVLVLEKREGELLEQAKKYVLDHYNREAERNMVEGVEVPKFTLEEVKKSPSDTPLPKEGTPVARWLTVNSQNPSNQKLVVLSALEIEDKLIVFFGESSGINAAYMEPYLLKLAASLKKSS